MAQEIIRLARHVDACCTSTNELLLSHITRACDLMFLHLQHLQGMSLWPLAFAALQLDPPALERLQQATRDLLVAAQAAMDVVMRQALATRSFFQWLIASA